MRESKGKARRGGSTHAPRQVAEVLVRAAHAEELVALVRDDGTEGRRVHAGGGLRRGRRDWIRQRLGQQPPPPYLDTNGQQPPPLGPHRPLLARLLARLGGSGR